MWFEKFCWNEKKTMKFPFFPENKLSRKDNFCDYVDEINPINCTPNEKVNCDWTDKKISPTHYRRITLFVGRGTIVDKNHELFSFRQSWWWKSFKSLNT